MNRSSGYRSHMSRNEHSAVEVVFNIKKVKVFLITNHYEILGKDSFSKTYDQVSKQRWRLFHFKHCRHGDGKCRAEGKSGKRRTDSISLGKIKGPTQAVKVKRSSLPSQTREQYRDQELLMNSEGKATWFQLQQQKSYLTHCMEAQISFLDFIR